MGANLYLVGVNPKDNSIDEAKPCPLCARSIIQAGINNVYLCVGEGTEKSSIFRSIRLCSSSSFRDYSNIGGTEQTRNENGANKQLLFR